MLQVKGLTVGYNSIPVVWRANIYAKSGEITSIIGPNGSGKSTLLKAIFSLIKPMEGEVILDGMDVTGKPPHELVKLGFSFLMQRRTCFPELTVAENLEIAMWKIRKEKEKTIEYLNEVYEMIPEINKLKKKKAYLLSGGEQRLVELARIFLQKPRIVLIDEPTVGLSPKMSYKIYEVLRKIKEEGVVVLMVEQNVRFAAQYSDKVYVMINGKISMEFSGNSLYDSLREVVQSWLKYT